MKLSRLTNRQLRSLLRRGEVRFADDVEENVGLLCKTYEKCNRAIRSDLSKVILEANKMVKRLSRKTLKERQKLIELVLAELESVSRYMDIVSKKNNEFIRRSW